MKGVGIVQPIVVRQLGESVNWKVGPHQSKGSASLFWPVMVSDADIVAVHLLMGGNLWLTI